MKIIKLLAEYLFVLISLVTFIFFLRFCIPGSPADTVLGPDVSQIQKELWLKEHGLLDPIWIQYIRYLKSLATGHLGQSYIYPQSVWQLISPNLKGSLFLTALSFLFIFILSFLWGLYGFVARSIWNRIVWESLNTILIAMPSMVMAPVLILLFVVHLKVFDLLRIDMNLKSLWLPALCLAIPLVAFNGQILAEQLKNYERAKFVSFARGLNIEPVVIFTKFIFKNALTPMISIFTLQIGALLSGTVAIEKIFGLPGLGRVLLQAIQERDHPVVSGCVILIGFLFTTLNLLSDLFYSWYDPRVRID